MQAYWHPGKTCADWPTKTSCPEGLVSSSSTHLCLNLSFLYFACLPFPLYSLQRILSLTCIYNFAPCHFLKFPFMSAVTYHSPQVTVFFTITYYFPISLPHKPHLRTFLLTNIFPYFRPHILITYFLRLSFTIITGDSHFLSIIYNAFRFFKVDFSPYLSFLIIYLHFLKNLYFAHFLGNGPFTGFISDS